ncbi:MAG: metallophosphoesterase [Lachnospiraceae bacterium]|nr:metallophosphoesterase [Lachnospiraceae bacterium]
MSTYVISDIHGNLRALQALLVEIDFKYDGRDKLYLLGDYVDWGPDSIATLEYVINLDTLPFVKCIIGNHDLMFLEEIVKNRTHSKVRDNNWLFNNRGLDTWAQYVALPEESQDLIYEWLRKLPYAQETYVKRHWYLLCHAGAYLPQKKRYVNSEELEGDKLYAVWHRIESGDEDPLTNLYERYPHHTWKKRRYERLICGHTVSVRYTKLAPGEPYRIYKGDKFINIDCGAKCMGLIPNREYVPASTILSGRLAALRLDDMAEFYVDRDQAGYTEIYKDMEDTELNHDYIDD